MNKLLLVALTALSTAKDGRAYYTAEFQDPTNPFAKTVKRNFWQQFDNNKQPIWRGADYAVVSTYIGKQLPGVIVTAEVEPFQIGERTITTFSTVTLGSELASQVFRSLGHPLMSASNVANVVAEPELAIA